MPFSRPKREPGNGGKPWPSDTGTPCAIYTNSKSAGHIHGKPPFTGWGGARNRADRTTDGLSRRQVETIVAGAETAVARGMPLNAHITIHWERLGVTDAAAGAATGAFLTYARDWLRKQEHAFAYVYSRENGDGKGSHVHMLAHLPSDADWGFHRTRPWLEAISDAAYVQGAIVTARIHGTRQGRVVQPDLYHANLARVVGYLTKGALPGVAAALTLERRAAGGTVIGKRAGRSENLR